MAACWSPDATIGRRAEELWARAPAEAKAAFPRLQLKMKYRDLYEGTIPRLGPGVGQPELLALDDPEAPAWEGVRDRLLGSQARLLAVGQERGPLSVLSRLRAELQVPVLRSAAVLPSGVPAWPAVWSAARLAEQERALAAEPGEYRRRFLLELPKAAEPEDGSVEFPLMQGYRRDPVGFARDLFGVELWDRLPGMGDEFSSQADIARSMVENRWVAVRSGNKVGKSYVAGLIAWWWGATRMGCKVILTAPVAKQVGVVWDAVHELYGMHVRMQSAAGSRPLLPNPALQPSTGLRWPDGRRIWGTTADDQASFQGPSSLATLVIVDEAVGVPEFIHQAILGIVASSGSVLALSNPLSDSGWWADAFLKPGKWERHRMAVHQSPTYLGDKRLPGLATELWVEEIRQHSGEQSQEWEVKVLGDFPSAGSDQVVALRDVEAGKARWASTPDKGPDLVLGLDVARFGDDRSVVCARRGLKLYTPAWFRERGIEAIAQGKDGRYVVGMLVACMRALRQSGEGVRVMLDATGGWGSSPADFLREMKDQGAIDERVQVVEVNFGSASADPTKWGRKRDELLMGVRAFLRELGGAMYPDADLERELMATKYGFLPTGAHKCEPKDAIKARTGRSPDLGDAAALAVYDGWAAVGDAIWEAFASEAYGWPQPAGGLLNGSSAY